MSTFGSMFSTNKSTIITYQGQKLFLSHRISVIGEEHFRLFFESRTGKKQGVMIQLANKTNQLSINNKNHHSPIELWEDHSPKTTDFIVKTNGADELVIYNFWEAVDHRGTRYIASGGSWGAMKIEEISNGYLYKCNIDSDAKFDNLVFRIERIDSGKR